jgi:transcriptional regulator with XRE-family HTH domain
MTDKVGLLRYYISRVENGYKTPSLKTLEKFALALGVPLYRLFYDGEHPSPPMRSSSRSDLEALLDSDPEDERSPHKLFLRELGSLWVRVGDFEHQILHDIAARLAARPEGAGGDKRRPDRAAFPKAFTSPLPAAPLGW